MTYDLWHKQVVAGKNRGATRILSGKEVIKACGRMVLAVPLTLANNTG